MTDFLIATILMSLTTAVFCYLAVTIIDFWIDWSNRRKDRELMEDYKRL